mgnify:CR=1 FL=1
MDCEEFTFSVGGPWVVGLGTLGWLGGCSAFLFFSFSFLGDHINNFIV